jgi:very-short-patch-repair endonuclease
MRFFIQSLCLSSAKDIWKYDKNRNEALKKEFGFVIFEVWEKSITKDGKETIIIEEIIDLIKKLYVSND